MKKAAKFRDQSQDELHATIRDMRKEMFNLVNEYRSTKKGTQPHTVRQKKKDIARALTVLSEKENASKA